MSEVYFLNLINPAGGFCYHYKAYTNKHSWASFLDQSKKWQTQLSNQNSKLLLIGPSAGYSLSSQLLSKYNQIDVLEIDSLAKWLFKKRFSKHPNIKFSNKIYFSIKNDSFNLIVEDLKQIKKDFPQHDIFFCNFLGQLPVLNKKISEQDYRLFFTEELHKILSDRTWYSYHDIFSVHFKKPHEIELFDVSSVDYFVDKLKEYGRNHSLLKFEVIDHLTQMNSKNDLLWLWPITPKSLHLIQAIYYTPEQ